MWPHPSPDAGDDGGSRWRCLGSRSMDMPGRRSSVPALPAALDRSSAWGPLRDAAGAGGAHDSAGWGPSGGGRYGIRSRAWLGWPEPPSMYFLAAWLHVALDFVLSPSLSLADIYTHHSLSLSRIVLCTCACAQAVHTSKPQQ